MKDNIMKLTDGLFHKVFDEVGEEYPDIEKESWIVDIGAAKLATSPEAFDVIVLENLYGDILSDVTAQMTGSVGLAGSANIGNSCSMFEAIHGSAPRRAGQNLANPSGLFLGAIMMLIHIGQADIAAKAHNAWLKTLEDGIHTYDIFKPNTSKQKAGTKEFADAVVERIGEKPKTLKAVEYKPVSTMTFNYDFPNLPRAKKKLVGVDVFIEWNEGTSNDFGEKMSKISTEGLKLSMISNRGLEVWPGGFPETFCVDHWRCRYEPETNGADVSHEKIVSLLNKIHDAGFDCIKTENLYTFDGVKGYSTTQG